MEIPPPCPPIAAVPNTETASRTFRLDCARMVFAGFLESAATTFLLLIAVRYLQAGAWAKAAVAAGGNLGLLLSPVVVSWVERSRLPATLGASRVLAVGGAACFLPALFPTLWLFVPASVLAMATSSAVVPLMTHVYHDNYPADRRGKLFAHSFMLRILGSMAFAWLGGRFLDLHPGAFRWLLVVFGVSFLAASALVRRIPSQPLRDSGGDHPLHALHFVREDRVFRQTLIVWMFMGFANLMMLPLRVEYLGNPRYGMAASASEIAWLTGVIPNLARLVMNPVWGWLFDRVNFFALRASLNMGFALGILTFFTSDSTTGLFLGAIVYGISNAGGDVAWGLWVTKVAPPGRVADYMSVHTFFTGIRGIFAPMAAFHLCQRFSMPVLGLGSAALIAIPSLMLLPEIWRWKNRESGSRNPARP